MEKQMKIKLTKFAIDRHFDPDTAGTTITDQSPKDFEKEVNEIILPEYAGKDRWQLRNGYAPFCKLLFVKNWTNARTGTFPITEENEKFLKSGYKQRNESELSVLVRWFENVPDVPKAKYLALVLYDNAQLKNEGTSIGDADYGIVAILGQMHNQEEPMTPMTVLRNALGISEGGSGVKLDRKAYMKSVEFWNANASIRI